MLPNLWGCKGWVAYVGWTLTFPRSKISVTTGDRALMQWRAVGDRNQVGAGKRDHGKVDL